MPCMNQETEQTVEALDFSAIEKKYVNKWIALSTDYKKVLAVGNSLRAVLEKTDQSEKVVMRVLPRLGYAPVVD